MLVGWKEYIELTELSDRLRIAKLDTGALTGCLGVETFETFDIGTSAHVKFKLAKTIVEPAPDWHILPIREWRLVRNSSGQEEKRPLIETMIKLGAQSHRLEFTLTRRSNMRTKVLLGRNTLRAFGYQVDPGRTYRLGRGS